MDTTDQPPAYSTIVPDHEHCQPISKDAKPHIVEIIHCEPAVKNRHRIFCGAEIGHASAIIEILPVTTYDELYAELLRRALASMDLQWTPRLTYAMALRKPRGCCGTGVYPDNWEAARSLLLDEKKAITLEFWIAELEEEVSTAKRWVKRCCVM